MMNSQNIDMTDIKTEEIWVDVEIVAKLKGITKRAVRLSLNNDKYEWKTEACRIAIDTVKEFITANDCFEKVIFIDINDTIIEIYKRILNS